MLRANIGTALDFTQPGITPAHLAQLGMRTIRIALKMPSQAAWATGKTASPLKTFLSGLRTFNTAHADQAIHVDLLLDPDMRAYGMGFAQLDEQRTIGAPGGKEEALTPILRFVKKAEYMLKRKASAAKTTIDKDKTLSALRDRLEAFGAAPPQANPVLRPTIEKLQEDVLEAAVLSATTPDTAHANAIAGQWNETYADVGQEFGAQCKAVIAALTGYDSVVRSVELGNEPQAQWATSGGFPGTATGREDVTTQFIETTRAAMAGVGTPAGGPDDPRGAARVGRRDRERGSDEDPARLRGLREGARRQHVRDAPQGVRDDVDRHERQGHDEPDGAAVDPRLQQPDVRCRDDQGAADGRDRGEVYARALRDRVPGRRRCRRDRRRANGTKNGRRAHEEPDDRHRRRGDRDPGSPAACPQIKIAAR